ncbi:MAG: hypothetical protein H0V29_01070 [Thermoleophilaceae bacterium]|nr:hypothetical protein [Thermoleophilaceae bacterium]
MRVMLDADQAKEMSDMATLELSSCGEELGNCWQDPDLALRLFAQMSPYVEILREIQAGQGVSRLDVLRELAQRSLNDAMSTVDYERRAMSKVAAGDMDWCAVGKTPAESQAATRAGIDERLREGEVAASVLAALEVR